jgi:rod shape-determining protein MreC
MRNLINFLIKYSIVFLFLTLQIISLGLIFQNRAYQRSVFLSSTNSVAAGLFQVTTSVTEFLKLKSANQELADENTQLRNELTVLQAKLMVVEDTINDFRVPPEMEYDFVSAKVISNSTNKIQNYITINKGALDGIQPDMGVISSEGVVGVVKTVSNRFATVIPVLNPMLQLSSKFKRTNYYGPLLWKGEDYRYAQLDDIARHVDVQKGDTIVTSGLTKTFPEGFFVGMVDGYLLGESSAYFDIKVKLAVNFKTLSYVKVIRYLNYSEQKELEENIQE